MAGEAADCDDAKAVSGADDDRALQRVGVISSEWLPGAFRGSDRPQCWKEARERVAEIEGLRARSDSAHN
jgi:hypothetical protein